MKINLTPMSIYGSIQYRDTASKIVASLVGNKWYPTLDGMMFDAGFTNIACMTDFLQNLDAYEETLSMLGYARYGNTFVSYVQEGYNSEIRISDDGRFEFTAEIDPTYAQTIGLRRSINRCRKVFDRFEDLERYIIAIYDRWSIDIFGSVTIASEAEAQSVIEAKMQMKDLLKNQVRVKSSNIWSYGIDIKNRKDRTGTVIVQFKDPHGGAGDIYQYFDIPIHSVWRKWLAASSKGAFFHKHIRNYYAYRKLTGDKKGKLPNAIN